jgi:hypothetical protein
MVFNLFPTAQNQLQCAYEPITARPIAEDEFGDPTIDGLY